MPGPAAHLVDRQTSFFALLTALLIVFAGHLAQAARPRSSNSSILTSGFPLSTDKAHATSGSSAAQTSAEQTQTISSSSDSESLASSVTSSQVHQTMSKLAEAVARWGEFVKKKHLLDHQKPSRNSRSSAFVAVGERGADVQREESGTPEETADEELKKWEERKGDVQAASDKIETPEDSAGLEGMVSALGDKPPCAEGEECKDAKAEEVFAEDAETVAMRGACPPQESGGEAKDNFLPPDEVQKRFQDCLSEVHKFADEVVMKKVRKNSEAANQMYGKAATNVATRLELLAAYKPSFLAINADHAENVKTLLNDAKEVVSVIDEIMSRNEPTVEVTGVPGGGDCDDDKKKEDGEAGEGGAAEATLASS